MEKETTNKPRRKRTLRNGLPINSNKQRTSKIPYHTRHTKPLPNINNIDEYDKEQLKALILLNRDKNGNPTHMGRPTDYKPEYDYMAYTLLKIHGINIEQLAEALGTTESGIRRWMDTYPNFKKDIIKGRDEFDEGALRNTLKSRAMGYDYKEKSTKYNNVPDQIADDGKVLSWKKVIVEQTIHDKHMAPSVGALAWYQKNKFPENWKDRKALELSGPDQGPVQSVIKTIMTTQEIEDELKDRGIPIPDTGGKRI